VAAGFAAERRLTAAKAAFLSVTPGTAGRRRRIARENAILQSNQDIPARKRVKWDERVGEFPGRGAPRPGLVDSRFSDEIQLLVAFRGEQSGYG
jgi:hypothetical protein